MLALLAVIGKVHAPERSLAWLEQHNLQPYLSPAEQVFIQERTPSQKSRVNFSWRAEALASLVWALRGLSEMPPLNQTFDVFANEMVRSAISDPRAFISSAQLRGKAELDFMEGYLFDQHWRVRDAQLGGPGRFPGQAPDGPPIEELDPEIVYERRYGLSWLVGCGDDWDDVPTDT